MKFSFIAEKAVEFSVVELCDALGVSDGSIWSTCAARGGCTGTSWEKVPLAVRAVAAGTVAAMTARG